MDESLIREIITKIEYDIDRFENQKFNEKDDHQNLGTIYTPKQVVDYIVSNIFKIYFINIISPNKEYKNRPTLEEVILSIIKNQISKEKLIKIVKNIRILDPSCGSGRFLVSIAEKLYWIYQKLGLKLSDFEIKKTIIEKNIFGIEIEKSAIFISNLRLIKWFLSTNINYFSVHEINLKRKKIKDFCEIIDLLDLKYNLFNLDFLLEFNYDKFDIIIGNPPYIENKKIKTIEYKKKLNKRFNSAYRLFDLSVVFIEKSIELVKDNGYISFILPNKFLSADYGIKIRELLIDQTEIKEIINISSLPIFQNASTYPIILSLKKAIYSKEQEINIRIFKNLNEFIDNKQINTIKFNQSLIKNIPSKVIPVSGNVELISYLFKNFKTFEETFKNLKIIYRPYGFLQYSKYFDNISNEFKNESDLILIGTGNIGKYHVKFEKRIKIAGKDIKVSYFNFQTSHEQIWNLLKNEKLIFREIAKELTCCYDPGIFTNITGLYFINIAHLNTNQLFTLLTILNSELIDSVFKTLFSTLHMAGGYLRFNGSFIKRLPMPKKFPYFLSQLGKILHLLSQLLYDFTSYELEFDMNVELREFKNKYQKEVKILFTFFNRLGNSLVKILYLDNFFLNSNLNYDILRTLLELKVKTINIPQKFLIPRFNIKSYRIFQINELSNILTKINEFYYQLYDKPDLISQLDHIEKSIF